MVLKWLKHLSSNKGSSGVPLVMIYLYSLKKWQKLEFDERIKAPSYELLWKYCPITEHLLHISSEKTFFLQMAIWWRKWLFILRWDKRSWIEWLSYYIYTYLVLSSLFSFFNSYFPNLFSIYLLLFIYVLLSFVSFVRKWHVYIFLKKYLIEYYIFVLLHDWTIAWLS
jgi:hypothetical protein